MMRTEYLILSSIRWDTNDPIESGDLGHSLRVIFKSRQHFNQTILHRPQAVEDAEAAFALYKNNICRLLPWVNPAVERPKLEMRPDPLRLNGQALSECAVIHQLD
jgi:hypothetical protein